MPLPNIVKITGTLDPNIIGLFVNNGSGVFTGSCGAVLRYYAPDLRWWITAGEYAWQKTDTAVDSPVGAYEPIAEYGPPEGTATVALCVPDAPVIESVSDDGGGQVTASVNGTGTITLRYRLRGQAAWTIGNSRSGSGDIVQTGLTQGAAYEFYAAAVLDGFDSAPSAVVEMELALAATSFVEWIAANQNVLTAVQLAAIDLIVEFGQEITYQPDGGTSRTILALIDYDGIKRLDAAQQGHAPVMTASVFNHAVYGISASAVDTAKDTIVIASRIGGETRARRLTRIVRQDAGIVQFEVR